LKLRIRGALNGRRGAEIELVLIEAFRELVTAAAGIGGLKHEVALEAVLNVEIPL